MSATGKQDVSPHELNAIYDRPLNTPVAIDLNQSLVSIIIPCFNAERYVSRAIRSVLAQTHTNLEVIVVDDGSTDNSVALVAELAKTDPRVKVTALLRNFGCYYARNYGIMHARGRYIGICDSDDILSPSRLINQVAALEKSKTAVACLGQLRRWTENFESPLNELRYGENSLLWDRSILNDLGWYDTTRYGADSEFRERIVARYGRHAVVQLDSEVYYLRTSEGSLTMLEASSAYSMSNGRLEQNLSPNRTRYQSNFRAWHTSRNTRKFIDFPQFDRPYELGDSGQNASPSLGQKRIGSMASFPKRRESLRLALPALLPQLDELCLYLNDYDEIPEFCTSPKLTVILGKDTAGDLRDNGKFYNLPLNDDSYVFTFDDDIVYPKDYVRRMVHFIEILERKVVVGVHGVNFPFDEFLELRQRTVQSFTNKSHGIFVDLLGTGTTAWHSSILKPRLTDFMTKGVCDLWFARLAADRGIPLLCIPREKGWLQQIDGDDETLWAEANQRPEKYFSVWENHLAPLFKDMRLRDRALADLKIKYSDETIQAAFEANQVSYQAVQMVGLKDEQVKRDNRSKNDPTRARTYKNVAVGVVVLYLLLLAVGIWLL